MRLFVGGVHSTTSRGEATELFEKFGEVEDVETGFSGFLFVLMRNKDDAIRAIRELDNTPALGSGNINVKESTVAGYETAVRQKDRRGSGNTRCYICDRHGHFARECPDRGRDSRRRDYSRSRSRSPKRRRRSRSPYRRRYSRSPPRRRSRSRSRSPYRRRYSRSPPRRRRSPSPYRRRSPSPYRRRSPSPNRRRSPSPGGWRQDRRENGDQFGRDVPPRD